MAHWLIVPFRDIGGISIRLNVSIIMDISPNTSQWLLTEPLENEPLLIVVYFSDAG